MKTYKSTSVSIILFLTILFSSCQKTFYTPSTQHVLPVKEKGEVRVAAAIGMPTFLEPIFFANTVLGPDLEGSISYSPFNGIGIYGALFNGTSSRDVRKGYKLGLGMYSNMDEDLVFQNYFIFERRHQSDEWRQTIFHPSDDEFPFGSAETNDHNYSYNSFNFSYQPSVCAIMKNYELSVGLNVKYQILENIRGTSNPTLALISNRRNLFVEPFISFAAGSSTYKIKFEFGLSENLASSSFNQNYTYYSVGFMLNLNKKKYKID